MTAPAVASRCVAAACDDRTSGRSQSTPQPPVGLYVHVPFCVSICPYCDFVVMSGAAARGPRSRVPAYLDAVGLELALRADALDRAFPDGRPPLASVYLGGGTPSLLPPSAVGGLLDLVRDRFGIASGAEITLEANPGPEERGDADAWRAIGITRLSLGAQALDADSLRRLGRRHRAADVVDAVHDARAAGIGSVSLDLLYDIPGAAPGEWVMALDAALALAPDHLSLYALRLDDPDAEGLTGAMGDHLPVRPGARAWRARARTRQDEDAAAAAYEHATVVLAAAGYRGYEISSWAKPGHASRHNLAYWRRLPVEAVGPGAHAFDGVERRWNAARIDAYVAALAGGRLPPGGTDEVTERTAEIEEILLGLRLDEGLPREALAAGPLAAHGTWALDAGLLAITGDDRVTLTTRGRLLGDALFARIV